MGNGVGAVVRALRARQGEIERAVFVRVREAVPESVGDLDSEYVQGLRVAVAAAVEFGLTGIEDGGEPAEIPREAAAQAQLAARSGVSLEAVLRRYIAGHALLWDYVMEEADRAERAGQESGLREMSRAQSAILDQLVVGVTREHVAELQRAGRSREQRLLERVRLLLAGEGEDRRAGIAPVGAGEPKLDYDLAGGHLGVIARGAGGEAALRELAQELDRRLLCVAPGEGIVWAWLGGREAPGTADLQRACAVWCERRGKALEGAAEPEGSAAEVVHFAVGEPARGLAGWRLTHRQAQEALVVSLRRPRLLTRYGEVALLAAALKDQTLSRSLFEMYLAPLEDPARGGGPALRETLHAYLAAGRNASSTASVLKVARSTVVNRLRTIEERLGRALHPWPAELEVALALDELNASGGA